MTNNGLDKFDRLILDRVQSNNRISSEALGLEIGLSTASTQRRLKRLRESGVIQQDVSILDPHLLGYPLQLLVQVSMERETAETLDNFKTQAVQHVCVQQVFYVTGECDFVLVVMARDMLHFESISDELFLKNATVKSFTTSVVMGNSEQSLLIPIDQA